MTNLDEQAKAIARKVSGRPDWTDSLAVQAWHRSDRRTEHDGTPGEPRIWSPDYRTTESWSTPSLRHVHWSDLVDVVPLAAPAGSYTRTAEPVDPDGDAAWWRARAEETEVQRDEWKARAEKAERALAEMTAHRDQCRDTAIKWQVEANRAEQYRPLTPDAIESVLHDILPLTANRLGEDDIASIASDLYLALTAPARDPRAEEMQADLATAEEPEMDDEDRRLIADHLAALGYRKAES